MSDDAAILSWLRKIALPRIEGPMLREHDTDFLTTDSAWVSDTLDWFEAPYDLYADCMVTFHAAPVSGTDYSVSIVVEESDHSSFPAYATNTSYAFELTQDKFPRGFPINRSGFRYARVVAQPPSVDLTDFEVHSIMEPALTRNRARSVSGSYPADTNLEFLAGAVQFGELPQGGVEAVGITRKKANKASIEEVGLGLATNILGADSTSAGSIFAEGSRDDISHDWSTEDPNDELNDTSSGGTAGTVANAGQAFFKTGTTPGNTCVFESPSTIFYQSSHDIRSEWTSEWMTIPTVAGAGNWLGLLDAVNGLAVGYDGTTESILHRRAGSDTAIPRANWNIDTLQAAVDSRFTKNGTPVTMDMTRPQRIRVKGALLGAESWDIEFRSPDKVWVPVHRIYRINEAVSGSIFSLFNLKMRAELDNTGSSTDIEVRTGSWVGSVNTSEASDFTQLLNRVLKNTDELRLDVEPTSSDYYLGKAADGSDTTAAIWDVMRIYLSATRNPDRIRFRKQVAWDSRTSGW